MSFKSFPNKSNAEFLFIYEGVLLLLLFFSSKGYYTFAVNCMIINVVIGIDWSDPKKIIMTVDLQWFI